MAVTVADLRMFADLPPAIVLPDVGVQQFIDMAALIIEEDFEGKDISVERLAMIELNLAAHYAIVSRERGGLTAQVVGQSEERYRLINDKAFGLASTRFGQQALSLDTTGTLIELATPPLRAQFRVI